MSVPLSPGGSRFEPSGIVVIKLRGGEYDLARRDELCAELEPAEASQEAIVDFADVVFADSTALGCLVRLKKIMTEANAGAVVRLIAVRPPIRRLFEITGMTKIFEIVPVE